MLTPVELGGETLGGGPWRGPPSALSGAIVTTAFAGGAGLGAGQREPGHVRLAQMLGRAGDLLRRPVRVQLPRLGLEAGEERVAAGSGAGGSVFGDGPLDVGGDAGAQDALFGCHGEPPGG